MLFAIGSVSPAFIKEEIPRAPSPFPTIPDVTETSTEQQNTLIVERCPSPFPKIPDVTLESETINEDVVKFQNNEKLESTTRPRSPFPTIPDVKLDPDIIEQDVVKIRGASPIPITINEEIKTDICSEGNHLKMLIEKGEESNRMKSEPEIPSTFSTIPDFSKNFDIKMAPKPKFFKPVRPFAHVSLTDKEYPSVLNQPVSKSPLECMRPEFNFALADTQFKVIENSFTNTTAANVKSLQSEIFESQGHFNVGRCASPRPVYIPVSPIPIKNEETTSQNVNENVQKIEVDENLIKRREIEERERNIKRIALATDTKEQIIKQQSCFSEVKEIKQAYVDADTNFNQFSKSVSNRSLDTDKGEIENNEVKTILTEMKKRQYGLDGNEGMHVTESKNVEKYIAETRNGKDEIEEVQTEMFAESKIFKEVSKPEASQADYSIEKDVKIETLNETINQADDIQRIRQQTDQKFIEKPVGKIQSIKSQIAAGILEIEKPKCKKPPETIIGARPLFGQLDINKEFQKAIIGKKSFQQRKAYEERQEQLKEQMRSDKKIITNEGVKEIRNETKLISDITESAKVETISKTDNEEIEKIYYTKEREYEVDVQLVQEEIITPNQRTGNIIRNQPIPSEYLSSNVIEPPSQFSDANLQKYVREDVVVEEEEEEQEEYKKIPVKSLIKNFEECSMPPMKYKQIRDPLPEVVDKISKSISTSDVPNYVEPHNKHIQEQYLKRAEEEFDNLFYIANTALENKQFYPMQIQQQNFIQSENSSFCKYETDTIAQVYDNKIATVPLTIEGKLLISFCLF